MNTEELPSVQCSQEIYHGTIRKGIPVYLHVNLPVLDCPVLSCHVIKAQ